MASTITAVERWIVTAWNADGGAYRYLAESRENADQQGAIFADMGLSRVSVRRVLMDARGNIV